MYGGKRNVEKNLAMLTYAVIYHHRNDSSSLPTFAVREKSTIVVSKTLPAVRGQSKFGPFCPIWR